MAPLRMCSIGDNTVDRYVDHGMWYPGGSAANVAVHARRWGVDAGYIGIVGSDDASALVRGSLESETVDLSRLRSEPGPNAYTDIYLDTDGNRHFGHHSAPASELLLDEKDLEYLRGCDWLHTGHSSATESQLGAMARVAPVMFDFSHRPLEYADPLLEHITIAAFSRPDLTDAQCRELLDDVCSRGPSTAVVTRGAQPTIAWQGTFATQAAHEVVVVDTLGAGDAFIAAFAVNVMRGTSLTAALGAATTYAAESCRHLGAYGHGMAAPPTRALGTHETAPTINPAPTAPNERSERA